MPKILLRFIFLSFAISWSMAGIISLLDMPTDSLTHQVLMGFWYMWGPAIAVLILSRGKKRGFLRKYGWQFERLRWPWLLANAFMPLAYVLLTLVIVFLLGNVLSLEGFGTLDLTKEGMNFRMESMILESGQDPDRLEDVEGLFTSLPIPGWSLVLLALVLSVIPGITLNLLFAFGEELGWRGLMLTETRRMGYVRSALFIGVVWGLWHAPLILQGHNYPDSPLMGIFMMCLFCVALSLVMNLLSLKGSTIMGAAAFHGVVNATPGISQLVIQDADPLWGSSVGFAGVLALLLLFGMLALTHKHTLVAWPTLNYDPALEEPSPSSSP